MNANPPKLHKFKAEWLTAYQIAKRTGMAVRTVYYRLDAGLPLDKPVKRGGGPKPKRLLFRGERLTVKEIAARAGVSPMQVYKNQDGERYYEKDERADPFAELPENCVVIVYRGTKDSLAAWSRRIGIKEKTLRNRIRRRKWPVERALTTPVKPQLKRGDKITFKGVTDTMTGWSRRVGINAATLYDRLNFMHWPIARALTEPATKMPERRKQAKAVLAMLDAFNAKHPPCPPPSTPKQTGGQSKTSAEHAATGLPRTNDDLVGDEP
jgi:hypothetical protein